MSNTIRGVFAAVLSPLAADGTVDAVMLAAHCPGCWRQAATV